MTPYEDWTLDKWEEMFNDIYESQNRGKSADQIWFRMIEEVSELVQPVQNQKYGAIENDLPDLFAWMMAFTRKKDIDLQSAIWRKFEDGCPSCGKETNCNCLLEDDSLKQNSRVEQDLDYFNHPTTLAEWQSYLDEIYGQANDNLPPDFLLSKLVEDIGIVAKYMRRKEPQERVEWKLSSVFAWTVGLCNRYSGETQERIELWELVKDKYDYRCAKCLQNPCECIYLSDIFISYPHELSAEMEAVKEYLESEDMTVHVFPELSRDMSEGRLFEAFSAIDMSDAGVVLLGKRFSSPVYAEYNTLIYNKDRNFVFCFVENGGNDREDEQQGFINEIRKSQKTLPFSDEQELLETLATEFEDAKRQARKLGY